MKKRGLSILLALCMVLALLPVMSAPAQAAVIGDDYPANLKAYKIDAITDDWGFFNRECTSFVAWRLNSTNGVAFHNYYGGPHWGNASNWGYAAQQIGITVDMNPAVGSVAWMSGGHVAWVAEVSGDNVTVEEYNWDGDGLYHKYTWPKSHYTGFIHIKDLGAPFPLNRDLADDFYAAIIMQDGWKHIAANGDNVEIASQNLNDPKQHWHFKNTTDVIWTAGAPEPITAQMLASVVSQAALRRSGGCATITTTGFPISAPVTAIACLTLPVQSLRAAPI